MNDYCDHLQCINGCIYQHDLRTEREILTNKIIHLATKEVIINESLESKAGYGVTGIRVLGIDSSSTLYLEIMINEPQMPTRVSSYYTYLWSRGHVYTPNVALIRDS